MLISKKLEAGDTATFKLTNGDELVARVEEVTDNGWKISKPTTVVPAQEGIALMQTVFTGDMTDPVELERRNTLFVMKSNDNITKHYIQVTTGIQTASSSDFTK